MTPSSYEDAGVSVERGDGLVASIASLKSPAMGAIGGFAGGMELDLSAYENPVLMSATDGVGTKLLVAQRLGNWSTVGQDLVAMCVNDLAVCGADPVQFLDYIACGRVDQEKLLTIVKGIADACEIAGCTLAGGETAELPGMYGDDDVDLAGFAVGLADKAYVLPRLSEIAEGDEILGLRSSGIHSNGLSLARAALADAPDSLWPELLTPTRIYCNEIQAIRHSVHAAAHITGGGLKANIDRVLPRGLQSAIGWTWTVPSIFEEIATRGSVEEAEMRSVFNMGIGIAVVAKVGSRDSLERTLGESIVPIGRVIRG